MLTLAMNNGFARCCIGMALISAALAGFPSPAHAQVYKWKDASGVTHYGEKPPEGGSSKEVHLNNTGSASGTGTGGGASTTRTNTSGNGTSTTTSTGGAAGGASAGPAAGKQNLQEQEREFRKRQTAREEAEAKTAAAQKELDAKCKYAAGRLDEMRRVGRLYDYNSDGERQYLSDQQREELLKQRGQEYAQNCQ